MLPYYFHSRLFFHKAPLALEKMKCIIHYFKETTSNGKYDGILQRNNYLFVWLEPDGLLTFSRQCIDSNSTPNFQELNLPLPKFHCDAKGLIEESPGLLQVDFANKYVRILPVI